MGDDLAQGRAFSRLQRPTVIVVPGVAGCEDFV
jgi:hypothetical protein